MLEIDYNPEQTAKPVAQEMSNKDYHAHPAISSTTLKYMDESFVHFDNRHLFKFGSKAMNLGTAFHTLTLEPEKFDEEFAIEPIDAKRNTTIGKAKWEDFEETLNGRNQISNDDYEKAKLMADNARAIGESLFSKDAYTEKSFIVTDPETGLQLKCRPDRYVIENKILIDLKSTANEDEYELKKSIAKYDYVRQLAFYKKVLEIAGIEVKVAALFFVPTMAPHMPKIRYVVQDKLDQARQDIDTMLRNYADYKAGNKQATIAKLIDVFE